jgi:hypothetical protein
VRVREPERLDFPIRLYQLMVLTFLGMMTKVLEPSDITSIGTAGVPCCTGQIRNLHFQNWQLQSSVTVRGGAAVHFQQVVRSDLFNWWACTQDCPKTF